MGSCCGRGQLQSLFRQIKAFVLSVGVRVGAGPPSSKHQPGGSILLFLSQEMAGARPGGERAVDHSVQGAALAVQPLIRPRRAGGQHHRFPCGIASGSSELFLSGSISPRPIAGALPDPFGGGLPTGCGRRRTLPMAEPTEGSASHGGAAAGGLAASTASPKGHPAGSWCREAALGHEEKAW